MKSTLKFALCSLVIAATYACAEQPKITKEYSIKNIISNSNPISISEMGAKLETIKLKTPDSILISTPSEIITTPTAIFIQTRTPLQIYRFDRDGNYMNKISTRGRAKNEYNGISAMFLNTEGNICVQDGDKVITFTPEGELVNSITMEQVNNVDDPSGTMNFGAFRRMYMDKQGNLFESFLVMSGNEKNKLIVTSPSKDTLLVSTNPIRYEFTGFTVAFDSRTVYNIDNKITYHQNYSDTVYTFDQNTSSLKSRFYFRNHAPLTNEDIKNLFKIKKERVYIDDVIEDSKYIYANISNRNDKKLYLLDKDSDESFEANFGLNHPDDDELAFYPRWESNDEFIFFYDVTQNPEPTILLMKKF